jgi:hypothetical protein
MEVENRGFINIERTDKYATPLPPLKSSCRFKSGTTERPRKAHISLGWATKLRPGKQQ